MTSMPGLTITATRTTREITVFPLRASADGEYLEARVGRMRFPSEMTAKAPGAPAWQIVELP